MKRKLVIAMLALTMATATVGTSLTAVPVLAGVTNVTTTKGEANLGRGDASITVAGNNATKTLKGKTFNLYKLFNAENSKDGESINYTFNPDCKQALQNVVGEKLNKDAADVTEYMVIDYIQSLNNYKVEGANAEQEENGYYSDFRYFIEDLRDELVKLGNGAADSFIINEVKDDGSFVISGLEYGYYVLDETTNNAGDNSASSLCIVNTANPNADVKIKSDYPSVEKKIQEDDNKDAVGNDGWNDMADYEIGQTVPYQFTSNVPDMNGYDTYYYAWHDIMDDALTFHPDSVSISIFEGDKEYKLSSSEFKVEEDKNGDTFTVSIDDLKSIVDAKFNHMDKNNHNTYGQKVVLSYNATLNDNAANDTGTPGFENKVKLEFSNDADSDGAGKTGETPWDTVVCFTYRLDGLKVNDHQKTLEGAKFRLYLDEDCNDEVYVKSTPGGYIVINDDSTNGGRPADAVEMVSDSKGVFNIIGLDSGTYYLKETDAPDGYRELLDPIKIDVVATFATDRNSYVEGDGANNKALTDLKFKANIKQFVNGAMDDKNVDLDTDITTGTGNLTVVNKVGSKLPVTGSAATMILVGAGAAIMTASKKLAKDKKEEE